jgi:hypothetical protein
MSYKKFVKKVSLPTAKLATADNDDADKFNGLYSKYKNYLPIVYQGPTNRIERYSIYDGMEQDPIISTSLDVLAEYITQSNGDDPFHIEYGTQAQLPESHTTSIEKTLDSWIKDNDWRKRIFNMIREVIKYGDSIYIRDPETNVLNKCNIYDVIGVVADENKEPTHYIIRNVDLNIPLKVANSSKNDVATQSLINSLNGNIPGNANSLSSQVPTKNINDPTADVSVLPIDAKHIVHLSMNVDNILLYPFGLSLLESIYKTYVQKMLLQDCILLYRIKNATEKLVFNIPVGNIPRNKRMQYMEKCKNELSQRRMPSKDSDGVFNTIDVAYNSIPMNEDYWLPVGENGVQPKIEKLPGGQALGEINDLQYWENTLIRGLKVPQSWIPYGPQDGQRTMPATTAATYVQEQRFFQFCKRIQNILIDTLDKEFKFYLKQSGINVDDDSFKLSFFTPSNITEITKMEIENTKLSLCSSALQNPYISKQFALKHYLGLTEEEFNENQKLLMLEMQNVLKDKDVQIPVTDNDSTPGLRSVNISDIPQEVYNDTKDSLQSGLGGMGGMGMDMPMNDASIQPPQNGMSDANLGTTQQSSNDMGM